APVVERARADGVKVRGYVSTVLGCPYQGDVPVDDVVRVAARMHALGCYEISLGDTIGIGTPSKARAMLRAVAAVVPMSALRSSIARCRVRADVRMRKGRPATWRRRMSLTCSKAWGSRRVSISAS